MNSSDRLRLERKINQAYQEKSINSSKNLSNYTSEKIKNLCKFLENEENSTLNLNNSKKLVGEDDNSTEERKKIDFLELELLESRKTIDTLKQTIDKEKIKSKEIELNLIEKTEIKLKEQKSEFESTIERQLKFIDQLILDKKELNRNYENLLGNFNEIEQKNEKMGLELKENFNKDLKANKDSWVLQEKKKKEKWIKDKTQEIKDATMKSLEREIQAIMNKNKLENKKFEEKLRKEYEIKNEQIINEYQEKFKEFKLKVKRDSEDNNENERDYYNKR